MISKMAREALGLSRAAYAEYMGRAQSLIFKRERGESPVPEAAQMVAHLILRLVAEIGRDEVLLALNSLSPDRRNEGGCFGVLVYLATRRGLLSIVEDALAIENSAMSPVVETQQSPKEASMSGVSSLVEGLRKTIRKHALKTDSRAGQYYEQAGALLAQVSEKVLMGLELEKRAESEESEDDSG
jgi:transcriptional regulator with XRE-family HTH domain